MYFYCKPLISFSVRELGISVFVSHCYGPAHRLFVVSQIFLTIFEITESICVKMKMLARVLILEGKNGTRV